MWEIECAAHIYFKVPYYLFPDLEALTAEQRGFERQYYSTNSLATRGVQIRRFMELVDQFWDNRAPFLCLTERVAFYAIWLARDLTYRSVLNYLLGLNYFLKQNGVEGIIYEEFLIQSMLKGIK